MNYKSLRHIQQLMQQCEPHPNNYAFIHTYKAAKETYDSCIRIINTALCSYCTDKGHCEWFCNGECFESKSKEED